MANVLTISRMILSVHILFYPCFSSEFYALYITAGLTDMVDGTIARKTGKESNVGALLDTIADFLLVVATLVKLIPNVELPVWALFFAGLILLVKIDSAFAGIIINKRLKPKHTILNKLTGTVLFLWPLSLGLIELKYSLPVVISLATIAAINELLLVLKDNR